MISGFMKIELSFSRSKNSFLAISPQTCSQKYDPTFSYLVVQRLFSGMVDKANSYRLWENGSYTLAAPIQVATGKICVFGGEK
jgi:hypothetical protein